MERDNQNDGAEINKMTSYVCHCAKHALSVPHWFQTSWWSQSCSSVSLPWQDFFSCASLHSVAAWDYLGRRVDRRWESSEHHRTNLPLTLSRDKNRTTHYVLYCTLYQNACGWMLKRRRHYPVTWCWWFHMTRTWERSAGQASSEVFWEWAEEWALAEEGKKYRYKSIGTRYFIESAEKVNSRHIRVHLGTILAFFFFLPLLWRMEQCHGQQVCSQAAVYFLLAPKHFEVYHQKFEETREEALQTSCTWNTRGSKERQRETHKSSTVN